MNLKNVGAREQVRKNFTDVSVQKNIDLDLDILGCYAEQLSKVEWYIQTQTKQHNPVHLNILKTIHGIGKILSLAILYEIGAIARFNTVQKFSSCARLVKCKAESAGKSYGTQERMSKPKHFQCLHTKKMTYAC